MGVAAVAAAASVERSQTWVLNNGVFIKAAPPAQSGAAPQARLPLRSSPHVWPAAAGMALCPPALQPTSPSHPPAHLRPPWTAAPAGGCPAHWPRPHGPCMPTPHTSRRAPPAASTAGRATKHARRRPLLPPPVQRRAGAPRGQGQRAGGRGRAAWRAPCARAAAAAPAAAGWAGRPSPGGCALRSGRARRRRRHGHACVHTQTQHTQHTRCIT